MPAATNPVINCVLVCDEVRREDNGKHIIIGVYGSDIVLSNIPKTVPLVACLIGKANGDSFSIRTKIEFIADNADDSGAWELQLDAKPQAAREREWIDIVMPSPKLNIECKSEGKLKVSFKHSSASKWKVLSEKIIRVSSDFST